MPPPPAGGATRRGPPTPAGDAPAVLASAGVAWAGEHPGALGEIRLVGFNEAVEEAFAAALGTG